MSVRSMRVLWLLAAAAALAVVATDTTTTASTTTGATTTVEGTTVTGSTGVPSTSAGVTTTIGGSTTTASGSSTTVVPSTTVVTTIDPCIVPTTADQSTTQAGTTAAGQTTTGGAATTSAGAATTSAGAATTSAGAATTSAGAATTTTAAVTITAGATTTSISDSTTAVGSTTTGAATTVGDSTTAGGSTTTGAATTVGSSTTAGFTTTSAVPVTTNCVTTTTMASTTTTPLYSNKDFVVSCADARCKYTLNAPAQDAAFLTEEEKLLDTANNTLFGISSDVSGLNDTYSLDAENVTAQIADWQAKLDRINDLLVAANLSVANLSSLLDTAEDGASDAQAFVLFLQLRQRDSCLYQSCLAPTTPSTTTTTTPVPTTTLDPCQAGEYRCENNGTCAINSVSGQPYCECPGDLDGQKHCSTGRCGLASDPTISGAGQLWSPGVNSSSPGNDTTSYASADCVWTMLPSNDGDIFQVDFDKYYHVSICGDNELWISNTFNNKVKLTSTTTSRQLSFVLNKGGAITLSLLASGDAPPPTGCYFALQMTEGPKPTKAPAEQQRESAWKWWPW